MSIALLRAILSQKSKVTAPANILPYNLLLHFEGDSIVDSSMYMHKISQHGIDHTSSENKFGDKSIRSTYNSYKYIKSDDLKMIIGINDFTINFWVKIHSYPGTSFLFDYRTNGSDTQGPVAFVEPYLVYADGTYNGNIIYTGVDIYTGTQWVNVEISRKTVDETTKIYVFINGVLCGNTTTPLRSFDSSSLLICAAQYYPPGVLAVDGNIDEFMLVIGQCLHTENFTPNAEPWPNPTENRPAQTLFSLGLGENNVATDFTGNSEVQTASAINPFTVEQISGNYWIKLTGSGYLTAKKQSGQLQEYDISGGDWYFGGWFCIDGYNSMPAATVFSEFFRLEVPSTPSHFGVGMPKEYSASNAVQLGEEVHIALYRYNRNLYLAYNGVPQIVANSLLHYANDGDFVIKMLFTGEEDNSSSQSIRRCRNVKLITGLHGFTENQFTPE